MITVKNRSQKYSQIPDAHNKAVIYKDFYDKPTIADFENNIISDDYEDTIEKIQKDLVILTDKQYQCGLSSLGSMVVIALSKDNILANSRYKNYIIPCEIGSLVILGSQFRCDYKIVLPELSIQLYDHNYTLEMYLSIAERLSNAEKIRQNLAPLHTLPMWKQCIQKYLNLTLLGSGCYGNVFKTCLEGRPFAVKISKLKPEAVENPYDLTINSWHEVYFMKDIIKPIIERRKCPNLPLIIDNFTCKECDIVLDDEKINTPSVITIIELANGDLKKYLQIKRTDTEIYSALFQIMAGLHAIQMNGQIMNFDVKKENILFYDVVSGGYWKYTIRGKDYYVPNCGKLFILNDFGISRPMAPDFPIYRDGWHRLGSRYGVIKDNCIIPFESKNDRSMTVKWNRKKKSTGGEFRINQKKKVETIQVDIPIEIKNFLKEKNIPIDHNNLDFYRFPDLVPPFEFYNDTQDVIRIFTGGKRTTQNGNHRCCPTISKGVCKELKKYVGKGDAMKSKKGVFSGPFNNPEQILAGRFIESFFGDKEEFVKKRNEKEIIEEYKI